MRISACTAARVRKLESTRAKRATKRELIVVAAMISRMIGTPLFSEWTEFSVTTPGWGSSPIPPAEQPSAPQSASVPCGSRPLLVKGPALLSPPSFSCLPPSHASARRDCVMILRDWALTNQITDHLHCRREVGHNQSLDLRTEACCDTFYRATEIPQPD